MIKIFAHRGCTINQVKENSIESLDLAYEKKFYGVEFDIWFIDEKLIVNHDKAAELRPEFADYLKYGNELKYWIDFKNLTEISSKNLILALEIAKKELKNAKIELKNVFFAPFIVNFEKALVIYAKIREIFGENAQIMAVCEKINSLDFLSYRKKLDENKIKFLSIKHSNINQEFVKIFAGIEIFAWTVNEKLDFERLNKLKIENITSDKILP
jgi:glycerophosphoryl diester phosphodiesterase